MWKRNLIMLYTDQKLENDVSVKYMEKESNDNLTLV